MWVRVRVIVVMNCHESAMYVSFRYSSASLSLVSSPPFSPHLLALWLSVTFWCLSELVISSSPSFQFQEFGLTSVLYHFRTRAAVISNPSRGGIVADDSRWGAHFQWRTLWAPLYFWAKRVLKPMDVNDDYPSPGRPPDGKYDRLCCFFELRHVVND